MMHERIGMLLLVATLRVAHAAPADDDGNDDDYDRGGAASEEAYAEPSVACCIGAPTIAEVLEAAYESAGLARDPTTSWSRRSRVAGLLPWLTVRAGRDTRWQERDPEIDHDFGLEVRATWRLDRLVFDSRELQASTIDAARRRERRRLASHVIRAYFAWRRAAASTSPGAGVRAEETAAELDALTDGGFSEALATGRRRALSRGSR